MNVSVFDWLANLPFVYVLLIAVVLYALQALVQRSQGLPEGTRRWLGETVESLLFAWVVVFVILKPFFVQAFYIPSESMVPTLQVRDRLLVAKLPYWVRGPQRGEIIVFKAPPNADRDGIERDYIKRTIGLPGERLEVREGRVWINGKALDEPYIQEPADAPFGPIVVPEGHYFMMGDNRNSSADSRYWGPLARDRVVGKAWLRFWPLDKIGFLGNPAYQGIAEEPQPAVGIPALMH